MCYEVFGLMVVVLVVKDHSTLVCIIAKYRQKSTIFDYFIYDDYTLLVKGLFIFGQRNMTIFDELLGFGLTENEAKTYLAVLELGEPTVGALEKHARLHKQLIYNAAQKLEERGLLSVHTIRGRKHFSVESPETFEDYAMLRLNKAKSLVPLLHEHANAQRSSDTARIFTGVKGVQQYYIDAARKAPKGSTLSILGMNNARYFEIFPQDGLAYQRFENIRTERSLSLQLVVLGSSADDAVLNKKRKHIAIRQFEEGILGPMDIMIWHNHVGMLFYGAVPYVLDIVGGDATKGFSEYFKIFWEKGKKVAV